MWEALYMGFIEGPEVRRDRETLQCTGGGLRRERFNFMVVFFFGGGGGGLDGSLIIIMEFWFVFHFVPSILLFLVTL